MSQRAILSETSGNQRPKRELSNAIKHTIGGRFLAGQRAAKIGKEENLLKRTVNKRIQRFKETGNHDNKPRSGRPRTYSPRTEKLILRIVRKEAKITFEDLRKEAGLTLSNNTLRGILKNNGIAH